MNSDLRGDYSDTLLACLVQCRDSEIQEHSNERHRRLCRDVRGVAHSEGDTKAFVRFGRHSPRTTPSSTRNAAYKQVVPCRM